MIFYNNDSVVVTEEAAYRSMNKRSQKKTHRFDWLVFFKCDSNLMIT